MHLSVSISLSQSGVYIPLSFCVSVCLSVDLVLDPSTFGAIEHLPLSVCISICVSVYLSVCLVCLSISPFLLVSLELSVSQGSLRSADGDLRTPGLAANEKYANSQN